MDPFRTSAVPSLVGRACSAALLFPASISLTFRPPDWQVGLFAIVIVSPRHGHGCCYSGVEVSCGAVVRCCLVLLRCTQSLLIYVAPPDQ